MNDQQYEEARLQWRRSLPDNLVRSLAADFLRDIVDECTLDAFEEYEHRFGKHASTHKAEAAREALRRKRSSFSYISPLYDERGQLR